MLNGVVDQTSVFHVPTGRGEYGLVLWCIFD